MWALLAGIPPGDVSSFFPLPFAGEGVPRPALSPAGAERVRVFKTAESEVTQRGLWVATKPDDNSPLAPLGEGPGGEGVAKNLAKKTRVSQESSECSS
jgi:hypothetical protein